MLLPPEDLRQILTYGEDEMLLYTRRMLLEEAGYEVDTVSSQEEFQARLKRMKKGQYDLLIVCHSVPAAKRKEIGSNLGSEILVYSLEASVAPQMFLRTVASLLPGKSRSGLTEP